MQQKSRKDELRQRLPIELARRLEGKSPQFGKTVFMKLVYLLQELYGVPLGYRFSLYVYGPYSPEVLADLEFSKLRHQVNVEYLKEEGGFKITPSERTDYAGKQGGAIDDYRDQLDKLVDHFGAFNARDLELRTTSIFLWKRIRPREVEDVNQVVETVWHLKPHFSKMTIRSAIDGLINDGVIQYFQSQ